MHIVHGQHPVKKLAGRLLELAGDGEPAVRLPAAGLVPRPTIHRKTYEYWLQEDDPLPWFLERCGIEAEDFQSGGIFTAISHETLDGHLEVLTGLDLADDPAGSLQKDPGIADKCRYRQTVPGDPPSARRYGKRRQRGSPCTVAAAPCG